MIKVSRFGDITQLKMGRTVLGRPLYITSAYFLDGLLIDTGPPAVGTELRRLLADLHPRQAVNTHAHEDHVGNNELLQAKGIAPQAHPLSLPLIAHPSVQYLYQRVVWGPVSSSTALPLGEEVTTRRYSFRVLHTPGHSPDHICLFEERHGWLFSGDLFLSPYVKVLRLDENPHQVIASLRKVLALPITTVFCGSGKVVEDGRAALQRKLDFWERLRDQARELHAQGVSPAAIRRRLLGREGVFRIITFGHFSKQNLIDALIRDQG